MVLLVFVAFVDHIQIAGLVERDVVRRLPGELIRQLRPVVQHFVPVLALAQNERRFGFLRGENGRRPAIPAAPATAPAATCKNSRRRIVEDMVRTPLAYPQSVTLLSRGTSPRYQSIKADSRVADDIDNHVAATRFAIIYRRLFGRGRFHLQLILGLFLRLRFIGRFLVSRCLVGSSLRFRCSLVGRGLVRRRFIRGGLVRRGFFRSGFLCGSRFCSGVTQLPSAAFRCRPRVRSPLPRSSSRLQDLVVPCLARPWLPQLASWPTSSSFVSRIFITTG